jgi:ubiquinone/menaquinone biosynthesis C-methylase UbiE
MMSPMSETGADKQIEDAETSPHVAFRTWEAEGESLTSVEARIHDGVAPEQLHARADSYLDMLESLFPEARPAPGGALLEIGSGVGYIMEAASRRYAPKRIVGLDVASGMIEKAKQRLARDGVDTTALEFVHYDGIDAPLEDDTFDLVYSVASLQHAPRPFCFRALEEANRVLKPGGHAFVHLLSYAHVGNPFTAEQFNEEIVRQIRGGEGHWHHFYTREELDKVLGFVIGVHGLRIEEIGGAIYLSFVG